MKIIEIRNLNKIYNSNKSNKFYALKNINLTINKGEIIILKGASGSGKSTLLSIIGALGQPTSGKIVVDNLNISKLPDYHASKYRNSKIGFIFQSFNLLEQLTVKQNIIAPLVISNKQSNNYKTDEILNKLNILHKRDDIVLTLSGGEKQRCAIARALITSPSIILADEPTAALDKQNSLDFIDILREFKELGITVIVSTHDTIFDNVEFVDNYINLKNGTIV
ncbi:ABC-type antimicrobial peptide transport system, ATPase component [hydrothermal vent metagenome]|uniref:ABC-type antimicrobial peptide transport system, ATPase component n=1 Tax=hydrothermal vent metagenome TaxID=652676 RepID=A0A3B1E4Z0_9ZZZZ